MDGLSLLFNRSLCLGDRGASPPVQPVSPRPGTNLGQSLGNLTVGSGGTLAIRGSPQPLPTLGSQIVKLGVFETRTLQVLTLQVLTLQILTLQTLIQKENPLWNS